MLSADGAHKKQPQQVAFWQVQQKQSTFELRWGNKNINRFLTIGPSEYLFLGFYDTTHLVILFFAKKAIYIVWFFSFLFIIFDQIYLLMINDFKTNEKVGV